MHFFLTPAIQDVFCLLDVESRYSVLDSQELILIVALPFASCGFHVPPRYEFLAALRAKKIKKDREQGMGCFYRPGLEEMNITSVHIPLVRTSPHFFNLNPRRGELEVGFLCEKLLARRDLIHGSCKTNFGEQ